MDMEGYPVWNHCGLEVESGPGWKYFIFGGTSKEFDETKLRERAESTNKMIYCDMEDEKLSIVNLNEEIVLPEPREVKIYYFSEDGITSGLVIFMVYAFQPLLVLLTVSNQYIQIWEEFQEIKK